MPPRPSTLRASLPHVVLVLLAFLVAAPLASAAGISPALKSADSVQDRSDHALVAGAHKQSSCAKGASTKAAARCGARHRALQRAGRKLAAAERRFAHKSAVSQRGATLAARQLPPTLTRENGKLTWSRVADVHTYLVLRKASGMTSNYAVVKSTTADPPAIPGKTITYRVRAAVYGSAWSAPKQVTYAPTPRTDPQSAPIASMSGQTLTWSQVGDVQDYVIVRKVAGREDVYTAVHGTSAAVTPAPGATATYSVRTAATGSASSPNVSITFPAAAPSTASTASTAPLTASTASSSTPGFQVGLNVRVNTVDDGKSMSILKPKLVRFQMPITNVSSGTSWVDFYSIARRPAAALDHV